MSSRDLPEWLVAALARQLESASREPLRRAQQHLSEVYRSGGHSNHAIRTSEDALAYAVVRMPATFAACTAVFEQLADIVPEFAPSSMLDIGAGPGTATFAASAQWPSCGRFELYEPHRQMSDIAGNLAQASGLGSRHTRSAARNLQSIAAPFDLVIASYVLTEQDEAATSHIVDQALRLASRFLILVEPGTKRGYQRLMTARSMALANGATIVAPCPATSACPLPSGDWCHFKTRLNRRKEHRLVKGADAPFEDEPYSYLVIAKSPASAASHARVLRPPSIGKSSIDVTLCTTTGLEKRTIPRRSKAAYKAAKRWSAGDAVYLDDQAIASEETSP